MKLAVIPARGGSKRIPRKNIRAFAGKPIIAWSIEAALRSALFERVLVSTDDEEIAAVARSAGAETPFLRPVSLADDFTGTNAVVRHAVEWMSDAGLALGAVCCIYATAPFVTAEALVAAARTLEEMQADFVFSATGFDFPVQRALAVDAEGLVRPMFPQFTMTRSQDLPEALHDAGQFYWGRAQAWRDYDSPFLGRSVAHRLARERVQDIDTEEDWRRAEWLFQALQQDATR